MLPHEVLRYPRMLFRGNGETCVVQSRDELLAKRAHGWRAQLLVGETPGDIGETPAPDDTGPVVDVVTGAGPDAAAPPPRRGRPKKGEAAAPPPGAE